MVPNYVIILGLLATPQIIFGLTHAEIIPKENLEKFATQYGKLECPQSVPNEPDNERSRIFFYSPIDRSDIGITFKGGDWSSDDIKKLLNDGLSPHKPTLIFLHGFTQNYKSQWLKNVRRRYDEMFPKFSDKEPKFNILFFDWSKYSYQSYSKSVSWVPHLGQVLSVFLKNLIEVAGFNMRKLQLISYSMSTHISGLASRAMPPGNKVSKIVALDPAGPCFHDKNSFAKSYALRPTDADTLVAQIYDMNGFGPKRPVGGIDIFVNGGSRQPLGKDSEFDIEAELKSQVEKEEEKAKTEEQPNPIYNHWRAVEHATQKLDDSCQEIAYSCSSYKAFLKGKCGSCGKNNEMCYYMNTLRAYSESESEIQSSRKFPPKTKMFIKTGSTTFCLHHYQIVLRMKSNFFLKNRQLVDSGAVSIDFGSNFEVKPRYRSRFSGKFTTLAVRPHILMIPDKAIVKIEHSKLESKDLLVSSIVSIELNYMSNISAQERSKRSARFCSTSKSDKFDRC